MQLVNVVSFRVQLIDAFSAIDLVH